jgi:hypothetical protein
MVDQFWGIETQPKKAEELEEEKVDDKEFFDVELPDIKDTGVNE